MKMNRYLLVSLVLVGAAGCGAQDDSAVSPGAPDPSVGTSATTGIEAEPAAVSTVESLPTETQPGQTVDPPGYLNDEHLAQLRTLQTQRPGLLERVHLPATVPFGKNELLIAVFAAATETGDFVTLSWSTDLAAPTSGWEAFPPVNITFSATPATDRLREFSATLPESGLVVNGAEARLGPDITDCGKEPSEEGHVEGDEEGVGHAVYLDETALAWEVDDVFYTVQSSPIVGCEPGPFTIEELANFADEAVVCDFLSSDGPKCTAVAS